MLSYRVSGEEPVVDKEKSAAYTMVVPSPYIYSCQSKRAQDVSSFSRWRREM